MKYSFLNAAKYRRVSLLLLHSRCHSYLNEDDEHLMNTTYSDSVVSPRVMVTNGCCHFN